jgi:TolB-like protein
VPDIFLSYNREDQATARRFAEAFTVAGYDVWWDVTLRSGEAYDQVTEQALGDAKAVVVLWSPRSVVSRWVRAEATQADRQGTLVPVMIEACKRPIMFELTQTAELGHWTGDPADRAWIAFLADVRRFVGGDRPPTQVKAPASAAPQPSSEPLLAVLAFDNLSADPEMSFFSDGISDEILETVARSSSLRVIGRASSFQFRGSDKAARRVGAELKATHVLDGAVRRSGGRVRISAQLVECASEIRVWSERFDRDLTDVFALQDEIAAAVAAALRAAFAPSRSAKRTINPEAYDLYLKSRDFSVARRFEEAAELLEPAVALEPDFALAWAALADARLWMNLLGGDRARGPRLHEARAALATAERLDPDLGLTRVVRSNLEPYAAFARREALLREALDITPGDAGCLNAMGASVGLVGRLQEARIYADDAIARDPLFPPAFDLRVAVWTDGYPALQAWWDTQRAKWPAFFPFSVGAAWTAAAEGDWPKYDELVAHARSQPFDEFQKQVMRNTFLTSEALRKGDGAYFDQMLAGMERDLARTGSVRLDGAWSAARSGKLEEVFALLERATFDAVLQPLGGGQLTGGWYPGLLFSPSVNGAMMADPRFVRLCAKLGLVGYWLDTGKWPDCADAVPYDFRAEARKSDAEGLARRA